MPSTCAEQHTQRTSNVINLIQTPEYTETLHNMVNQALNNIQRLFYADRESMEMHKLRSKLETASHAQWLAVFFLLLNVEEGLKTDLLNMEVIENQRKVTRFLLDLRNERVPMFFTNEYESVPSFVEKCNDTYCIA